MWIKTKDLIKSTNNTSDDYDEKYIKIRFNSDDHLLLHDIILLDLFSIAAMNTNHKFS